MKHYVCLEELDEIIERNTLWKPAFWELTKNMNAITKADICKEFAERLKARAKVFEGYNYTGIDEKPFDLVSAVPEVAIDNVLAEMEGE